MLAWFEDLVLVALGIEFVRQYLVVNKVWIRKHERPVAESVSVIACLISFGTTTPFLVHFVAERDYPQVTRMVLALVVTVVWFAIGIGLWVPGWSTRGAWQAMRKALRIERHEWTDMLRAFSRHGHGERILEILRRFAMVDRQLAPEEARILEAFAETWGLPKPEVKDVEAPDYVLFRKCVEDYLAHSPPAEQAGQLADLLHLLAAADQRIASEERIALGEVERLIHDYLDGAAVPSLVYEVLLVPQGAEQEAATRELLPALEPTGRFGGRVYSVGTYHHTPYAELVADQYRARGLLSFVHALVPGSALHALQPAAGRA